MTQRWTRKELNGLVAARAGQTEGQGPDAFIEVRIKVTPELLKQMIGGYWTATDGSLARFDGVNVSDDGYAEPIFVKVASPMGPSPDRVP